MRMIIVILMIIFAINAIANARENVRPVRGMLAYGGEYRPEENVQSQYETHTLKNLALGAGYGKWLAIFERASFEESTGNATLNLKRTLEDTMLWGHYRAFSWNYMVPFLGLGAGYYQETVDTNLLGATSSNKSDQKLLMGGAFGISLDVPILWLSVEGRLLFGDELDRQPTIGALVRIGAYF